MLSLLWLASQPLICILRNIHWSIKVAKKVYRIYIWAYYESKSVVRTCRQRDSAPRINRILESFEVSSAGIGFKNDRRSEGKLWYSSQVPFVCHVETVQMVANVTQEGRTFRTASDIILPATLSVLFTWITNFLAAGICDELIPLGWIPDTLSKPRYSPPQPSGLM